MQIRPAILLSVVGLLALSACSEPNKIEYIAWGTGLGALTGNFVAFGACPLFAGPACPTPYVVGGAALGAVVGAIASKDLPWTVPPAGAAKP